MQKLTITAAGTYLIDVVPGRVVHLATSGSAITAEIKYLTAPGVYQSLTPALSLSGQQSVINYGAHNELAVVVGSVSGTAIVIANPEALQERGR